MKWSRRTRAAIAVGIAMTLGAVAMGVANLRVRSLSRPPLNGSIASPTMSDDGLVSVDFVDLFPHKFWISDWSSDSQYPDGFRYKLLSSRHESRHVIQFLVVLEHRSGDKEVLSTLDVKASVFDRVAAEFVDGLAEQHGLDFEEQDFSSCRTSEDFDQEAARAGWR